METSDVKSRRTFLVVREELKSGMSQRRGLSPPSLPPPGAPPWPAGSLTPSSQTGCSPLTTWPRFAVFHARPLLCFLAGSAGRWPGPGREVGRGLQPLCSCAPLLPQPAACSLPSTAAWPVQGSPRPVFLLPVPLPPLHGPE